MFQRILIFSFLFVLALVQAPSTASAQQQQKDPVQTALTEAKSAISRYSNLIAVLEMEDLGMPKDLAEALNRLNDAVKAGDAAGVIREAPTVRLGFVTMISNIKSQAGPQLNQQLVAAKQSMQSAKQVVRGLESQVKKLESAKDKIKGEIKRVLLAMQNPRDFEHYCAMSQRCRELEEELSDCDDALSNAEEDLEEAEDTYDDAESAVQDIQDKLEAVRKA